MMSPVGQLGDLYREGRERFIDVVRGADPTRRVAACPKWTVKDVLAHVAGIPADILAGKVEGVATEPWTQAQVDARSSRSIDGICREWEETGPQIDAIVDTFGPTGAQLLFDLTTHELDVRAAVGAPFPDDLEVYDVALDFVMTNLVRAAVAERGSLRIVAGDRTWTAGAGDPRATLTTTKRELIRAIAGRRSGAQIAAMDWEGDPTPFLDAFASGPFTFPTSDIIE
jgi:uncharacterized protein (TIGR03083 family)